MAVTSWGIPLEVGANLTTYALTAEMAVSVQCKDDKEADC